MQTKRCYYEVLQVSRTASVAEITASYRKLAIKYHPDKNPGNEEAVLRFKEAAEAFEILSDEQKRARYDRHGHAGVEGQSHQFHDINEIFSAFGELFGGGGFGDLFGGRGGRRVRKGGDIGTEVTIDLLEAAKGCKKTLRFERHQKCETCAGSGAKDASKKQQCQYCGGRGQVVQATGIFRVQTTCPVCTGSGSVIKDPCNKCRGNGYVPRTVELDLDIPPGIDDGMRMRLSGEGEPSPEGGPPGDCYCLVHVTEHPLFQRDGQTLICQVPITYSQAALGSTIQVPTLDGPHELEIPAGTQPGDVFKLRGKGLRDPRGRGAGDQLVQVILEVPKKLNAKTRQLLEQLAAEDHVNVSPKRKTFFQQLTEFFVPIENPPAGE
ncbi:MAG: molecular chaperone DnaJ [Pirellulales bacterium]|nr:molecular chaperone DnaJ [Pirellulales bacterium]